MARVTMVTNQRSMNRLATRIMRRPSDKANQFFEADLS